MTMPTEKSAAVEAMTQEIIDMVRAEVGDVDLTADSSLQNQGLDSLKIMSFVFKIEARYDIALEDDDGEDPQTIGELAELVVRRIEDQP